MIVTGRFVFLHLHKSGGSFVNEFLLESFPDARRIGYHLPRVLIPAAQAALPVLGLVRNPWSYYVSWYAFQSQLPRPNALFRILSRDGTRNFAATLRHMLDLGAGSTLLDQIVTALPPTYTHQGLNLPGTALSAIRGSGTGFYTFLYRYMFQGAGEPTRVGRMEHLRTDLAAMLAAVGQPLDAAAHQRLQTRPVSNTSQHTAYVGYYDHALRELVAQRDAAVIARHAYRFEDGMV